MASRYNVTNESEMAFMKEIIKHDPELQDAPQETLDRMRLEASRGTSNPGALFEELVARVGNFTRSDEQKGDDYLKGQGDAKTIKLGENTRFSQKDILEGKSSATSCYGSIRGLKNKQGPLRIMAYNERMKTIQYIFLPTKAWKERVNSDGDGMKINYNETDGTYGELQEYCTDFAGVCRTEEVAADQDSVKTPKEKQDKFFDGLFA